MVNTFSELREGDEIVFTKISNSKVFVGPEGSIFRTKISRMVKTCDNHRASISFERPINGRFAITVDLDKSVHISYNTNDEITLDVDVFGVSKKAVLARTLAIINARIVQIDGIKRKCEDNTDDLLIAGTALEIEQEKSEEVSLEEAASMAL